MIWGLDFLAGVKYRSLILAEHPQGFAGGIFGDTFGDARDFVERWFGTGRVPIIRVHLTWKDNHDFSEKDIALTARKAARWKKFSAIYKRSLQISPWCEHRVRTPVLLKLHDAIKNTLPDSEYVNTPIAGGDILGQVLNEIHGPHEVPNGERFNFSFDGTPCVDADVTHYKQTREKAEIFFLWDTRFNLRWETSDTTPRPERKGKPDQKLIDSNIYLHRDKEAPSLPARWLWKSHSENKGTGDPRAEKPVLICPPKTREIKLFAKNGQAIETLRYYGTYTDGRHRYYASSWGYEIAEKARRIQGHSVCEVRHDSKLIGTVNPAFRENEYRNRL